MTDETPPREFVAAAEEQRETMKRAYWLLRDACAANGLEAEAEMVEALYAAHIETFDLLVKALGAGMSVSQRVMQLVKTDD